MKEEEVLQSKHWSSYWLGGTEVLIGSSCDCVYTTQKKKNVDLLKQDFVWNTLAAVYSSRLFNPCLSSHEFCIRRHGPV